MGVFQRLQDITTDAGLVLLETNRRFRVALDKINRSNPGPYTANDLTDDVTHTAVNVMLFWLKFLKPLGDPVLPTVTITAPATTIAGNTGLKGTVSIVEPITGVLTGTLPPPPPALPSVTPLVFMGWATVPAPKDASQIAPLAMKSPIPESDMDPLRQDLTVYLQVPGAAATPERGTYQGFILNGQAPIAIVIVRSL